MKRLFVFLLISILMLFACRKKATNNPQGPLTLTVETKELAGLKEPHTPAEYNKVGYNRYYLQNQTVENMPILIIISGYIAGTGWFDRMAKDLVIRKNCEVWSVIRRQAYYEKQAELKNDIDKFISVTNESARKRLLAKLNHTKNYMRGGFDPIAHWGLDVQLEDIKKVVEEAKKVSKNIYLSGWSDGVEYVMAYAHYKFASTGFGHKDLKGMVFFDENPEWGWATKKEKAKWLDDMIKVQEKLMAQKDVYYYMNYYPSIAVHVLAGELARLKPNEASPLVEAFGTIPKEIKDYGITNRALFGWLYEQSVSNYDKNIRGGFAYLINAGDISIDKDNPKNQKENLIAWKSYKETKEVTDIQEMINSTTAPGYLWELFYPRKVLLDYWKIAQCDFNCPEMHVYENKENNLPIYYILTGTNNVGNGTPPALSWYLTKNSIQKNQVVFNRLYHYSHADMFFAEKAPDELYRPLYNWMLTTSGLIKSE